MKNGLYFTLLLPAAILLAACGSPRSDGTSAPIMQNAAPANAYEHNDLIRVGDVLVIRLTGVPMEEQGAFELRADEGGQISMPYIGNIRAAGLTTVQLKDKIETLYKLKKIFSAPNITVMTQQTRYVSVTGEVRSPSRIPYSNDLTALSVIATCGGFSDYADRRHIRILRGNDVIEFNANEAMQDPSKDISILPDDRIQINRSVF